MARTWVLSDLERKRRYWQGLPMQGPQPRQRRRTQVLSKLERERRAWQS